MKVTDDVGPQVLDFLFDALKIDGPWSVRDSRSFTWWGYRLAQRVWAEPARLSHDHHIVRIHAATAVLRDVRDAPEMRARLSTTNRFMSLGAVVWSEQSKQILLHSAACFHGENAPWLRRLFLAAVGIQVADAHIKADALAHALGGTPDVSAHPRSGPRDEPDDILSVIAASIAPAGAGSSPWTESDFKGTAEMTPRPWVLATSDATGMAAEFPFAGNRPAMVAGGETALLTASATDRHPQLGAGVLLKLQLPFNCTEEKGSDLAWILNLIESGDGADGHTLGAWCLGPTLPGRPGAHALTFVSFVPAAVYRKGVLDNLVLDMAIRTRWVARAYLGDQSPALTSPEEMAQAIARAQLPSHIEEMRRAVRQGEAIIRSEAVDNAITEATLTELWKTRAVGDQVQCWACRAPLTVTAETRGKKIRCPRCGTKQVLPR